MHKFFLAIFLLLASIMPAFAGTSPKIFFNEEEVISKNPPLVINNRVIVPFRAIFQALDHKVNWNETTQSITSEDIYLKINNRIAKIGDKAIVLDVPAQLFENNSVTYVPLRFISEALGKEVRWDEKNNKVVIIDNFQKYFKYLVRVSKAWLFNSITSVWDFSKKHFPNIDISKGLGKWFPAKKTESTIDKTYTDKQMIVIPYGLEKKFLLDCSWFNKKDYIRTEMGDYVIYKQKIHKGLGK